MRFPSLETNVYTPFSSAELSALFNTYVNINSIVCLRFAFHPCATILIITLPQPDSMCVITHTECHGILKPYVRPLITAPESKKWEASSARSVRGAEQSRCCSVPVWAQIPCKLFLRHRAHSAFAPLYVGRTYPCVDVGGVALTGSFSCCVCSLAGWLLACPLSHLPVYGIWHVVYCVHAVSLSTEYTRFTWAISASERVCDRAEKWKS